MFPFLPICSWPLKLSFEFFPGYAEPAHSKYWRWAGKTKEHDEELHSMALENQFSGVGVLYVPNLAQW